MRGAPDLVPHVVAGGNQGGQQAGRVLALSPGDTSYLSVHLSQSEKLIINNHVYIDQLGTPL